MSGGMTNAKAQGTQRLAKDFSALLRVLCVSALNPARATVMASRDRRGAHFKIAR